MEEYMIIYVSVMLTVLCSSILIHMMYQAREWVYDLTLTDIKEESTWRKGVITINGVKFIIYNYTFTVRRLKDIIKYMSNRSVLHVEKEKVYITITPEVKISLRKKDNQAYEVHIIMVTLSPIPNSTFIQFVSDKAQILYNGRALVELRSSKITIMISYRGEPLWRFKRS